MAVLTINKYKVALTALEKRDISKFVDEMIEESESDYTVGCVGKLKLALTEKIIKHIENNLDIH